MNERRKNTEYTGAQCLEAIMYDHSVYIQKEMITRSSDLIQKLNPGSGTIGEPYHGVSAFSGGERGLSFSLYDNKP